MTSEDMVRHLRKRYRTLVRSHPGRKHISEAQYLANNLPGMLFNKAWRKKRAVNPRRRRRRMTKAFDRCLRDVKAAGTARKPAAVCVKALKGRAFRKRRRVRRNPSRYPRSGAMYVLVAVSGPTRLAYLGGRKFGKSGRPVLFPSRDAAVTLGTFLKSLFPVLRAWTMTTVEA